MLPPAARLIFDPRNFTTGALARDSQGRPCGTTPRSGSLEHDQAGKAILVDGGGPVSFDALGAILWAYKGTEIENRHAAAKRAFDTCKARFGHAFLGKLQHEQAFSLLADAGV